MFRRISALVVRRPRQVLAVGLLALVVSAFLGMSVFGKLHDQGFTDPASESSREQALLEQRFGGGTDFVLAVSSADGPVTAGAARGAAQDLTDRLRSDPALTDVVSFLDAPDAGLVSPDGRYGLVTARAADPDTLDPAAVVARYDHSDDDVTVRVGGQQGMFADAHRQLNHDLGLAETVAVPLILVLLVLAFGNLVAALVTIAVGVFSVVGTFAGLSVLASLTDVSVYSLNLTTALCLGLSVDYGLLMVARVREERATHPTAEAVARAVQTAGRTIAFSATTVAVALASLTFFPLYFLQSMAYAGIGIMVVTATGAVVLLPALLVLLGDRIDALPVPGVRGVRGGAAPFWSRFAGLVVRRPLRIAGPVLVGLLVMAAPLTGISLGMGDERVLPTSAGSRQVGDLVREHFEGDSADPIPVVTTTALPDDELAAYATRLSHVAQVDYVDTRLGRWADGQLVDTTVNPSLVGPGDQLPETGPGAERLAVVTSLDPLSAAARDQVRALRAVPDPAGAQGLVGGWAAELTDTLDAVGHRLPLALGWLLGTTVVILFLFTGSLVQPLRALLLNAVGLGGTVGAMVWVFQEGHLSGVLGFTPMPVEISMFVLLLVVAFGLSMDYEVFVIGRITEMRQAGHPHREAVVQGLAHTGRIVSTAAALIAVSLFAFATSRISFMQFLGLGTGLAILVDATLVRGVLLPASMRLLGERAWWAPGPLRALHRRFGLHEQPQARPAPEPHVVASDTSAERDVVAP